ncbi:MAG: hypothetical protein EAY75_03645 [Bacteroidetes bacterium]|nr:MAG: hypothetical protein EAY75_03645 [Bacteroidota bacterium]
MYTFKKIDAYVQLALVVGSLVLLTVNGFRHFYLGYFVIGGWQMLSLLGHAWGSKHLFMGQRRRQYTRVLCLLLVLAVVALASVYGILPFLLLLTVVSPALALWYMAIVFTELKNLQHRQFIQMR